MKLSTYQQAIIEWAKSDSGNACCNAVAGSGKSTTLQLTAKALQESGISPSAIKILVFGKANSQDLIRKFGKSWEPSISTLHSAGWALIKDHLRIKNAQGLIKPNKYKAIAQKQGFTAERGNIGSLKREGAIAKDEEFLELADLVRLTNKEPLEENIKELCKHFELPDIRKHREVADAIAYLLKIGEAEAKKGIAFDFTDQVWLPARWELEPYQPYRFVLIDECQDLNAAQLELALNLAGKHGRILAVGDPRQAIMGFAGADNRSYQKIVQRLAAKELPLSICYRCPSSVIDLVKSNFPEIPIERSPTAAVGKIQTIKEKDLWDWDFDGFSKIPKPSNLQEGDMVISRKTAPLVSLCIKLIAKGIPATVKGRAIGDQIKGDLKEIAKMPGFRYENFNDAATGYKMAKFERYKGLDNEEQLKENLSDKVEALQTIYSSQPQANSIADLETYIDSLFSDEHSPITLSTCHRAKGLEGERIFIIKPEDLPMTWRNQQDWQLEQEYNLLYVALTRSKSELYIVGEPDWHSKEEEETVKPTVKAEEPEETIKPLQCDDNCKEPTTCKIAGCPNAPTPEQKRETIKATLLDADWEGKSDRAIAEATGSSAPTVAKVRRQLVEEGTLPESDFRISKSGKKLQTANIGTKPKSAKERIKEIIAELEREEILEIAEWLSAALEKSG